jgi:hypothetical protein
MTQISSEPAHNAATLNDEVTLALRALLKNARLPSVTCWTKADNVISRMICA